MQTIKLPAKIENLRKLIQFTLDRAMDAGFAEKRAATLELALEEALVNVINHGYQTESGDVEIRCDSDGGKEFIIEIIDTGRPFDIHSLKDPDISADVNDRKVGGLGVFLIKKLIDKVESRRVDNKNILTLVVESHETEPK